jgi:hypothetical protein
MKLRALLAAHCLCDLSQSKRQSLMKQKVVPFLNRHFFFTLPLCMETHSFTEGPFLGLAFQHGSRQCCLMPCGAARDPGECDLPLSPILLYAVSSVCCENTFYVSVHRTRKSCLLLT